MDSSPTSSPTTSQFFKACSTGPPRRTYSRRGRSSAGQKARETTTTHEQAKVTGKAGTQIASRCRSPSGDGWDLSPSPTPRKRQNRLAVTADSQEPAPRSLRRTRSSQKARQESVDLGSPDEAGPSSLKRKRGGPGSSTTPSMKPRRSQRDSRPASDVIEDEISVRPRTPSPPPRGPLDEVAIHNDPQTPPRSVLRRLPGTPGSASPGDFAEMFAAISPGGGRSPLGTPRTKKLLGKSQSSGAVLDSPSKLRSRFELVQQQSRFGSALSSGPSTPSNALVKSASMPITPSRSSPITVPSEADPSAMLIKATIPEGLGSGGRAKRVYGRTRTVVAEDQKLSAAQETLEEQLAKQSYADLRKRYEVNAGEGDIDPDDFPGLILARAPQPVNDMRSKGENRRYMDETVYLLDGIIDPGASRGFKRSSSVDLLESMVQEEWLGKMKVCDLTERVWSAFKDARGAGEEPIDTVCLLALYIIVRSGDGIDVIIRSDSEYLVTFVLGQLRQARGLMDAKSAIKSTPLVERVRKVGRRLLEDGDSSQASTEYLASSIMAAICQPDMSQETASTLQSQRALTKLSKITLASGKTLAQRFELHESGLDLLPPGCSVHTLNNHLASTDALFLASSGQDGIAGFSEGLVTGLLQILVAMTVLSLLRERDVIEQAAASISHALKTLANVINVAPACVSYLRGTHGSTLALARVIHHRHVLAAPAIPEPSEGDKDGTQEVIGPDELLSLALAILTSACLEEQTFVGDLVRLKLEPGCVGKGPCLRACQCPDAELFAVSLAQLYKECASASSTPDMEIVGAYLALLLTKLITAAKSEKELIVGPLPGDTQPEKLNGLSSSLHELEGYRSLLDRRVKDMVGLESDSWQDDQGVVRQAMTDLQALIDAVAAT